jgi:uncharacterized membrane protein YozB (DUF420 family)
MAIAMALTIFLGFTSTYYLKIFGDGPMLTISRSPFSPLIHVHALLFTAWVVLFIVQTVLVASHRVAVHRRLGVAGGVLAAAMVTVGTAAAINGAARGVAPPGIDPLAFLAIPLFDMVVFCSLVAAALLLRRNKEAHKRLMLLAYISIIVAAMARLPGVLPLGPLAFFGLAFIFLLAAVIYDWVTRRRVHKAYVWGGGLLVASVPLRLMISSTQAWKAFAEFVTR